jgi:hypothetical protein
MVVLLFVLKQDREIREAGRGQGASIANLA